MSDPATWGVAHLVLFGAVCVAALAILSALAIRMCSTPVEEHVERALAQPLARVGFRCSLCRRHAVVYTANLPAMLAAIDAQVCADCTDTLTRLDMEISS